MAKRVYTFLAVVCFACCSCSKSQVKGPSNGNTNTPPPVPYISSAPISLTGVHDIVISGKSINGGSVPAIALYNCYNVHITQNALGNSTDVGIYLYQCYHIKIEYNYISNVAAGVYADHSAGDSTIVDYNQFLNMQGPFPRGQFVQFSAVNGTGNSISNNRGENLSGKSAAQDDINIYNSNGTASSPIKIAANRIRGGGPASSSGGIMLGDHGGSYETASGNILVDPGQMGISITGGDHINLINNSVYSAAFPFSNVGVAVWAQAGYTITNATVSGNEVKFMNSGGVENDYWLATGQSVPGGWNTNSWGANIGATILPATLISPTAATSPIPVP